MTNINLKNVHFSDDSYQIDSEGKPGPSESAVCILGSNVSCLEWVEVAKTFFESGKVFKQKPSQIIMGKASEKQKQKTSHYSVFTYEYNFKAS